MNIFSEKYIAEGYRITGVTFHTDRSKHAEALILTFHPEQGGKEQRHYFNHGVPMHSTWMQVLDYAMPDDRKTPDILTELENDTRTCLSLPKRPTERLLLSFLDGLTKEAYADISKQMLKTLQDTITTRPVFGYLYPLYYEILYALHCYTGRKLKADKCAVVLLPLYQKLDREFARFHTVYQDAHAYCEAVFLTANKTEDGLFPADIASVYHSYCLDNDLTDFYADSLSAMTMQPSAVWHHPVKDWKDYLHTYCEKAGDDKKRVYPVTSLEQFLHIGIDRMLETESVIRVCKLCGGYFRIRYSVSQEYCTRLYGKTKASCNEYASRKSYKQKLFKHPIHTEFTKAYNRLYGRGRRGQITEEQTSELMEQLKSLHDEYYEKYENTHQKDREQVWREYMQKNKELLG